MKIKLFISLVAALLCTAAAAQDSGGQKTIVYVTANRMTQVDVADSTAIVQVGSVVAYHNGSVITCDSLIQYNDQHIECFGDVIINKDSTYVYGERLDYDGEKNIARVFSSLVKMIDGEAVLYTYNFLFNTLDNIGEYYGGGTLARGETTLESDRGFYYSDSKDVICVGDVELRDATYQITSDSLGYNMDSEVATFYSKSLIWNDKGEILSADKGWYYTRDERYRFVSNAYVLTEDQEIWADDIDYRAEVEDIIMRRNIQIRDEEQKTIGFGDYGLYFGQSGNAMLTERPSVVNFDEGSDSIYMRADSIFLFVLDSTSIYSSEYAGNKQVETTASDGSLIGEEMLIGGTPPGLDAAVQEKHEELTEEIMAAEEEEAALLAENGAPGEMPFSMGPGAETDGSAAPDEGPHISVEGGGASSLEGHIPDGVLEPAATDATRSLEAGDGQPSDTNSGLGAESDKPKTKAELKAEKRAEKARVKAERRAARDRRRVEKERQRNPSTPGAGLDAAGSENAVDSLGAGVGVSELSDGAVGELAAALADGSSEGEATAPEGVEGVEEAAGEGELSVDGTSEEVEAGPVEEKEPERVVVGYNNVKIFRSDFQAVCDSLIGFSRDSTIHLHTKPIMWNGDNQITSDLAVVHTRNEELYKAVFTGGNPVMGTNLGAPRYNQVTGKTIEAFFENNEIYRVNAVGNGQTYYYIQDEETGDYQGFLVVECADITFHIANRNVDEIVYRGNPVYSIYPMNKIPESQERIMPNFEWHGDLKPTKKDVFDRTERPTQREHYVALPLPQFPLSGQIHTYRRALIDMGMWRDRTDDISRNARNFIRDIESGSINL